MKKYEFVVQDIISKISQKLISDKLPTERELSESYNVSRFTIRKALEKLQSIGIIYIKSGSGIYIYKNLDSSPLIYNSITEKRFNEISYKKIKINKRLTDSQEKQAFLLDDNDYIWNLKRLRLIDGKVTQIEETKIPVKMFPKMSDEIVEHSLQKHAIELGLKIEKYLTTYRAINISAEDAKLFGCKRSTAAMNITNRGFLKSGEVFIVSNVIDIDYQCTYHTPFNTEDIEFREKNSR
ncbi:GntR family transcriptional regulator [Vibrio coralliilyticus]|uniref:GntR family transcriptional regulator n=1 Tax=Vibrio coralliilyticus TaxID=190893 RepID=UPI001E6574F8|nr:GntR family transcriptional regulator [Vibrio coralliilyticus]MCC2521381.1 GntR family transcriptional regulator [Vibrio coralliilyticus]